jgi:hypothetical protein
MSEEYELVPSPEAPAPKEATEGVGQPRVFRPLDKSRLTINEIIYHQSPEQSPTSIQSSFGIWLDSTEQPYVRINRTAPADAWVKLEVGWLAEVGISLVLIENEESKHIAINPTEAEKTEIDNRVLGLAFDPTSLFPQFIVRPGSSSRFTPTQDLYIRGLTGPVKYSVHIFPR